MGVKRAVVYTRPVRWEPDTHEAELVRYCKRRGWRVVRICGDVAGDARMIGPAFGELLVHAGLREFDVVVVWRFSSVVMAIAQALNVREDLASSGVELVAYLQPVDSSVYGKYIYGLCAAVAEMELDAAGEEEAGL